MTKKISRVLATVLTLAAHSQLRQALTVSVE